MTQSLGGEGSGESIYHGNGDAPAGKQKKRDF
jgi:hypothetical protein